MLRGLAVTGAFAGLVWAGLLLGRDALGYGRWSTPFALAFAASATWPVARAGMLLLAMVSRPREDDRSGGRLAERLYGEGAANRNAAWLIAVLAPVPLGTLAGQYGPSVVPDLHSWEIVAAAILGGLTVWLAVASTLDTLAFTAGSVVLSRLGGQHPTGRAARSRAVGAMRLVSLSTLLGTALAVVAVAGGLAASGLATRVYGVHLVWALVAGLSLAGAVVVVALFAIGGPWQALARFRAETPGRLDCKTANGAGPSEALASAGSVLDGTCEEFGAYVGWLTLIPACVVAWLTLNSHVWAVLAGVAAAFAVGVVAMVLGGALDSMCLDSLRRKIERARALHEWDGCVCTVCGEVRQEGHDWDGCQCRLCGGSRHELRGCQCTRCGASLHRWRGCQCARCGALRDGPHRYADGICVRCQREFLAELAPHERTVVSDLEASTYTSALAPPAADATSADGGSVPALALLHRLPSGDVKALQASAERRRAGDRARTTDRQRALKRYRAAAALNPYNRAALLGYGVGVAEDGDLGAGLKMLKRACALAPRDTTAPVDILLSRVAKPEQFVREHAGALAKLRGAAVVGALARAFPGLRHSELAGAREREARALQLAEVREGDGRKARGLVALETPGCQIAVALASAGDVELVQSANLHRWRMSGQALAWVVTHRGSWDHTDWLALLEELRASGFWPIGEAEVGAMLEEIGQVYRSAHLDAEASGLRSLAAESVLPAGSGQLPGWTYVTSGRSWAALEAARAAQEGLRDQLDVSFRTDASVHNMPDFVITIGLKQVVDGTRGHRDTPRHLILQGRLLGEELYLRGGVGRMRQVLMGETLSSSRIIDVVWDGIGGWQA